MKNTAIRTIATAALAIALAGCGAGSASTGTSSTGDKVIKVGATACFFKFLSNLCSSDRYKII